MRERVLLVGRRTLGWTAAIVGVELFGATAASSLWVVLLPAAPFVLAAGLVAGSASIVVGALRSRPVDPSDDPVLSAEANLHIVLLVNTVLFLASAQVGVWRTSLSDDAWWWVLGAMIVTGSVALLGIPVAVWIGWHRAVGPRRPPGRRQDVVRLSLLLNSAVAVDLLVQTVAWPGGVAF